jgi:hypothetical protein
MRLGWQQRLNQELQNKDFSHFLQKNKKILANFFALFAWD